jgi:predicted CopG family antitoxin
MGEAGMNEAVVPLPNGRSIPVEFPHSPSSNTSFSEMIEELKSLRAETADLKAEVAGHREEQQRQHHASLKEQRETSDRLARIDETGIKSRENA